MSATNSGKNSSHSPPNNLITITYDKYKSNYNSKDNLNDCLSTDIIYVCLPTEFNNKKNKYTYY